MMAPDAPHLSSAIELSSSTLSKNMRAGRARNRARYHAIHIQGGPAKSGGLPDLQCSTMNQGLYHLWTCTEVMKPGLGRYSFCVCLAKPPLAHHLLRRSSHATPAYCKTATDATPILASLTAIDTAFLDDHLATTSTSLTRRQQAVSWPAASNDGVNRWQGMEH